MKPNAIFNLFLILFVAILLPKHGYTQVRGCEAREHYGQQYEVQDIPISRPYQKYDFYGNYLGYFQVWKRARWYREDGGGYVYVWNGSNWNYQWNNSYYYWFDWVDYERFVGY